MKNILPKIFLAMILLTAYTIENSMFIRSAHAEKDTPEYAKWGSLAMKTAKSKYPQAQIIDYLHIGREEKGTHAVEKFKLWVRENGQEFGLYIFIEFDPKSNKVKNIQLEKSDR
ncbi:DUF3889 domain-containing protein [Cytobacillus purgationiresistens]|uniref:DUF3889 domain-containing protein n=1 Tax=Cytobacillus purgationiresistens TaxID=863449 RepID=A0ABU0AC63_9BACI|nr:DUF3889 domain-containing protein [Cytobacillus purgationiresistens]MDQ0268387.1 hypothetical protein [Cytobacillus purgationiresistens]